MVSVVPLFLRSPRAEWSSQMNDDTIFMGDLAYDYLACEANVSSGYIPPYWFGCSPPLEYTYRSIDYLSPVSPFSGSVTPPSAM
jgi:hypothetical protein